MTQLSSKQVTNFLQSNDKDLHFILSKVNQLEKLKQKIAAYLNPSLAKYCHVAQVRENKLILIVTNGSHATQLRFQTTEMLAQFKKDATLKHIQEIECKVNPICIPSIQDHTQHYFEPMASLSKQTADTIKNMAETISDPLLKEIMQRIAKHTEDESN